MIRSVYSKVLFGFAAITVLGGGAVAVTASLLLDKPGGPGPFVERGQAFHAEEAAEALRTGGPPALARFLQRLNAAHPARHYLLQPDGRDAVDGTDRSELLARGSAHPRPGRPAVIARPTDGGRYVLVAQLDRHPGPVPPDLPYFLWVPAAMGAGCLVLAYFLVRPVRQLRAAVERFGRGEFGARSGVTVRDEFGQLATAFDRMAEQIERLVMAERRLIQDVSHELRSPLARLVFAVELAETAGDRPAAFSRVRKEVRRLTDLVAELIELTRAEADPGAPADGPVALADVVREVADDALIEAEARGCRVEVLIDTEPRIAGRAGLLHRAIENVVRNAIRYAPPDTAVEVALTGYNGRAVVTVRDYGPGVPEHALESIFVPFFRVEEHRGRGPDGDGGGMGLGLAIARRAVTVHGGRIAALNAGPGLVVRIALPALAPGSSAEPSTSYTGAS